MNGLLGVPPQQQQPQQPVLPRQGLNPGTGLGNNVSFKELLEALFKRGLLAPAAQALTPVDPVNAQDMARTLTTRQRQMQEQGLD